MTPSAVVEMMAAATLSSSYGIYNLQGGALSNSGTITVSNTGFTGILNDNTGGITNNAGGTIVVSNPGNYGIYNIDYSHIPAQRLFPEASAKLVRADIKKRGTRVGYVMGVGDQVPAGIAQLGARVQLLDEKDLASGDLARFDAIVTGTRAYVVREDLRTYNQRLLDYVKSGGNLIVLYNTPEFVPAKLAPYPADLPPAPGPFRLFSAVGPPVPLCTWTPPDRRKAAPHALIGIQHGRGTRVSGPLAEVGITIPERSGPTGPDPREPLATDGADVKQCRTFSTTTNTWTSDQCPHLGGIDQDIYGARTP